MAANLSDIEKEIIALQGCVKSINSMVNHENLEVQKFDKDYCIIFTSRIYQVYFNIILLDFFNASLVLVNKNCMDAISSIFKNPGFNSKVSDLEKSVSSFDSWLNSYMRFEHNCMVAKQWFTSIDLEIGLKIT